MFSMRFQYVKRRKNRLDSIYRFNTSVKNYIINNNNLSRGPYIYIFDNIIVFFYILIAHLTRDDEFDQKKNPPYDNFDILNLILTYH